MVYEFDHLFNEKVVPHAFAPFYVGEYDHPINSFSLNL